MEYSGIDIFCTVIDNFGDAGVVYRLAKELKKAVPYKKVRVFFNRYEELVSVNPDIDRAEKEQEIRGIEYILRETEIFKDITPSEIVIEAFGCDIDEEYMEKINNNTIILNLEYLSAEEWVEEYHKMSSFTGKSNVKKYFFMPGFTEKTGGLIIDSSEKRKDRNVLNEFYRGNYKNKKIGTVFSYEHNFEKLIEDLYGVKEEILLLVMGEKSKLSFINSMGDKFILDKEGVYKNENIEIVFMPFVTQEKYDEIISAADFNFVRGEESLARAALLGKPFIWHAYLQEEMVHMDKVEAFLKIFSSHVKDKKKFEKYFNLVYNYNHRMKNDFEVQNNESYVHFFEEFEEIKRWSEAFARYLKKECNLVQKLVYFINNEKF